jgi:hypothetical protein
MFCSESQLVGVGHEMNPTEFTMGGDMIWGVARKLDEMTSTTKVKGGSRFSDAKNIFGGGGARSGKNSKTKTECKTRHTGCITCVNSLSPPGEAITKFATTGVDGKLFFWDL